MTNEVLKDAGSSSSYRPKMIPLQDGPKTSACITHITDAGASSSTHAGPGPVTGSVTTAEQIALHAAGLVGGDRQKTHGNKTENHQNIAALWNAYLGWRLDGDARLTPKDVALMMALLKIARTKTGSHNPDDYLDLVGYGAVAGEIAERAK